jgi:hypothetical protein
VYLYTFSPRAICPHCCEVERDITAYTDGKKWENNRAILAPGKCGHRSPLFAFGAHIHVVFNLHTAYTFIVYTVHIYNTCSVFRKRATGSVVGKLFVSSCRSAKSGPDRTRYNVLKTRNLRNRKKTSGKKIFALIHDIHYYIIINLI